MYPPGRLPAIAGRKSNVASVCHAFDGRRVGLGGYRGDRGGRRKHATQQATPFVRPEIARRRARNSFPRARIARSRREQEKHDGQDEYATDLL
jgi:hypothetical protein